MSVTLNTEAAAPRDRAELIRELIWDRVVRVEIEHQPEPRDIHARGQIVDAGRLTVCSIRSNATTVERTSALARDPDDAYIFIGLQLSGSSMVIQDGREAVLRSGDLAIYDTRRPYTLVNERGIDQHFFRVPVSDLELSGRVLGSLTATRLGGSRPLAQVTAGHLLQVADTIADMSQREAHEVAHATLVLVRALLTSQVDSVPGAREHLEHSLETRIIQFARHHLADPDLSARVIADAHHVSVRQVYRLLGRTGISLGDWVREQRLEAAKRDLADPGVTATIAAVAHRWGFVDLTHFGRSFKTAYAMTPREWRAVSRAGHRDVVPDCPTPSRMSEQAGSLAHQAERPAELLT
jgi:AraC-like DNA-binding protein